MAPRLAHATVKELAGFGFETQPSIDPKLVRDRAASRWIARGENVLLLGAPGIGNTHWSTAIGREVILAGYGPVHRGADADPPRGSASGAWTRNCSRWQEPKLRIVDELGPSQRAASVLPLDQAPLTGRSHRTAALPNGPPILDRLLHRSQALDHPRR
ncbi:hypothetical protein ACVIW2_000333 [Bradyrhizobium huanghuaihaiense]